MIGDTIVAEATAPGCAARAVIRLSGPAARAVAQRVFAPTLPAARAQTEGHVLVREQRLPALALTMPGPHSFTGEDVVELHVPGSALLVRLLQDDLLRDGAAAGVRAALPGEFTARACQHGKLDLPQVEGLLMLLHAGDRHQAAAAVQWLHGGLGDAVTQLRGQLQDALALLEVSLDFDDGETGAVPTAAWSERLPPLCERVDELLATLPVVAPGGEVLLLGRANAGKSSLANALAGRQAALVAAVAGTTRDLLRIEVAAADDLEGGAKVQLWDAPGDLDQPSVADAMALALRERLAGRAAALLVVLDATDVQLPPAALTLALPWFGVVLTKCDLVDAVPALPEAARLRLPAQNRLFATSAHDGRGLQELRRELVRGASSGAVDAGAPLRTALLAARAAIGRAIAAVALGPELCAAELHAGLHALDGIAGEHSPEQLLNRIYGSFCLGK